MSNISILTLVRVSGSQQNREIVTFDSFCEFPELIKTGNDKLPLSAKAFLSDCDIFVTWPSTSHHGVMHEVLVMTRDVTCVAPTSLRSRQDAVATGHLGVISHR